PRVDAQLPAAPDDRYAGLQWRFVRIKYHYITEGTRYQSQEYYGEPWYIDAPAAEQNLSRRVKTATAIQVEDPIVLTLDDPRLFNYPWIYFVEPGNLKMLDGDVATLREFLGGRSFEKSGFIAHLRTILDDTGRPMVFINWNTDMGDGWEWSNVEDYPGYIKYTAMAYRMGINEIVYALTH